MESSSIEHLKIQPHVTILDAPVALQQKLQKTKEILVYFALLRLLCSFPDVFFTICQAQNGQ